MIRTLLQAYVITSIAFLVGLTSYTIVVNEVIEPLIFKTFFPYAATPPRHPSQHRAADAICQYANALSKAATTASNFVTRAYHVICNPDNMGGWFSRNRGDQQRYFLRGVPRRDTEGDAIDRGRRHPRSIPDRSLRKIVLHVQGKERPTRRRGSTRDISTGHRECQSGTLEGDRLHTEFDQLAKCPNGKSNGISGNSQRTSAGPGVGPQAIHLPELLTICSPTCDHHQ